MKKNLCKKLLAGVAIFAILLATAGCGAKKNSSENDNSLKKVLDAGQFVLGLDTEYPPMGFIDETGEIVGFDIDIAREVCTRLGVSLVTKGIDWDAKEDLLNNGDIDCIWNGMSVTPARAKSMNLSESYIKNELIFVVVGGSDILGLDDLKGKKVGVQSGSSTQDVIEATDFRADIEIVTFDTNMELMKSLTEGNMEAAFVDSLNAHYYIASSDKQFFVLPDGLNEEECAIGFRKGDGALRDKVQEIVSEMKVDGSLGEISKKWFGSDITIVK